MTVIGLLPRSMMAKPPLRYTTCAATRDTVRSGSGSMRWLVSARPMVPPSSSKLALSPLSAGTLLKVMTLRVITAGWVEWIALGRSPRGRAPDGDFEHTGCAGARHTPSTP